MLAGFAGTAISVAVLVMTLTVLLMGRQQELARAVASSTNVAITLAREIGRNVELYDLSLQAVAEGAADPRTSALPRDIRRRVLFDRSTAAQYVSSVLVIDRDGRIVIGRDPVRAHPSLRERDFFIAQEPPTASGLFISRPYASVTRGGAPSLGFSRRITLHDGSFGGVAMLAVNLDYFQLMVDSLAVGTGGAALVLQTDGTVVARNPPLKAGEPNNVAHSPTFGRMLAAKRGFYAARSPVDGVRRLYSFVRVPDTNLIVVFAPSYDDLLADWRHRSLVIALLALLLSGAFTYVVWALVFVLRYRIALQAQISHLADTDALTGVSNRRSLDKSLERIWSACRDSGAPLSVLFVDADHFKAYNDDHGHAAGDEALKLIAHCLRAQTRPGIDTVARYGGEEFVIVLPDCGLAQALQVAERIRASIENGAPSVSSAASAASAASASPPSHAAAKPMPPVTVSVGCSTLRPAAGGSAALALRAADRALYAAKDCGRNCVSAATAAMYESGPSKDCSTRRASRVDGSTVV